MTSEGLRMTVRGAFQAVEVAQTCFLGLRFEPNLPWDNPADPENRPALVPARLPFRDPHERRPPRLQHFAPLTIGLFHRLAASGDAA